MEDWYKSKWAIGGAIAAAIALALYFITGSAFVYTIYVNRYGKNLILLGFLKEKFLQMQQSLQTLGIDIEMTDAWRGQSDQEAAYAAGNSKAHFGQSAHNFGAAFDCAPVVDGALNWDVDDDTWSAIGNAGKSLGLVWGGDFKSIVDKPHFEPPGWQKESQSGQLTLQYTAPVVGEA